MIEYEKIIASVVRPDGVDDFNQYVGKWHPGHIVNTLHHGGHVDTIRMDDIDPTFLDLHDQWWKPDRE
ncbi:MAG: hypothetical protein AAF456_23930 [Planctomycetota bacterium]